MYIIVYVLHAKARAGISRPRLYAYVYVYMAELLFKKINQANLRINEKYIFII